MDLLTATFKIQSSITLLLTPYWLDEAEVNIATENVNTVGYRSAVVCVVTSHL